MRIALVGGTGEIGEALALRLGRDTELSLAIGSRDEVKAKESAETYRDELHRRGIDRSIASGTNAIVADDADVVVLAVPPYYVTESIGSIESVLDPETVLVSPAVGMADSPDGLRYDPPSSGSVAELAAETAPEDVPVVAAFTNVPAERVADLDEPVDMDTPVVGDSSAAKRIVVEIVSEIDGLRPVDAGSLSNAPELEALTPLLINIARQNGDLADLGVKFV